MKVPAKLATVIANDLDALSVLWGNVESALQAFNGAREDLYNLIGDEVAGPLREEYDAKSEKWRDSDKGQQCLAMVEAWEEFRDSLEPQSEADGPEIPDSPPYANYEEF